MDYLATTTTVTTSNRKNPNYESNSRLSPKKCDPRSNNSHKTLDSLFKNFNDALVYDDSSLNQKSDPLKNRNTDEFLNSINSSNSIHSNKDNSRSLFSSTTTYNESYIENSSNLNNNHFMSIVNAYEELINMQIHEIENISFQKAFLTNKVKNIAKYIDIYHEHLQENEEKIAVLENSLNDTENRLLEIHNSNESLRRIIGEMVKKNKEPLSNDENNIEIASNHQNLSDEDFVTYIESAFLSIIDDRNAHYIRKEKYEVVIEQMEILIQLLMGIANKEEENDKRTFLLGQCARIGHYIDEQINENDCEDLGTFNEISEILNIFQNLDSKNAIEVLFDHKNSDDADKQLQYREIVSYLLGVSKINQMLMKNNSELLKEKEEMIRSLQYLQDKEKTNEEWKQKQINNISLINDTLGDTDFAPDDMIPNLIKVYQDTLNENKELIEELSAIKDPNILNEEINEIKSKFTSLEHEFVTEKVKYRNTISEMTNQIQDKEKMISEMKEALEKNSDSKRKIKQELKAIQLHEKELTNNLTQFEANEIRLVKENEELKKTINENEKSLAAVNSRIEELQKQFEQMQKDYDRKIKKHKQIIKCYQSQINEYEENICQKESQYRFYLEKCKKLTHKFKEKLMLVSNENETLKAHYNEVSAKVSESILAEKSLRAQIILMKKKEDTVLNENNLLKNEISKSKEMYSKKVDSISSLLSDIMNNSFHINTPCNSSIEHMISIIEKKIQEANKIYEDEKYTSKQMALTLSQIKSENNNLKSEMRINKSFSPNRRFFGDNVNNDDLNNWETWAKSLCHRICGNLVSKPDEMRFLIEETMMCSIGYKDVYQKLELLRREKKFFNILMEMRHSNFVAIAPSHTRSIICLIMFCGRLRKMAGAKRIEAILSPKTAKLNFSPIVWKNNGLSNSSRVLSFSNESK
ncbi:hypothetical protein TRFO_40530 [Tritrichomonas foetus]|uniref:Uncharacterized protein n=1 Tax=Tritrichomonas foetus TaxID=1144522 RepID=A0A1J4J6T1_9EUKA|nr:hypothetical protein TRFO_40530 [Tritrichomonas foetus]|eukprot:OHS93141.1 hypothetical protein TRFO_40530 [Tritrichomonas foetus]